MTQAYDPGLFDLLAFDGQTEGGAFDDLTFDSGAFDPGVRTGDLVFNKKPTAAGNPVDLIFGAGGVVQPSGSLAIVFDHSHGSDVSPLDIVFGGGDDVIVIPPSPVTVSIKLDVPVVQVTANLGYPTVVTNIVLGKPVPAVLATYVTNTQRPTINKTDNSFQKAVRAEAIIDSKHDDTLKSPQGNQNGWTEANALYTQFTPAHDDAIRTRTAAESPHQVAQPLPVVQAISPFQVALDHVRLYLNVLHDVALHGANGWTSGHEVGDTLRAYWTLGQDVALRNNTEVDNSFQKAVNRILSDTAPHQVAMRPPPGRHDVPVVVVPPVEPCYTPPLGNAVHLLFDALQPSSTNLLFFCENHTVPPQPGETIVLPIKRVYMTFNDFMLKIVGTNTVIPALGFNITLDRDSWAFGFNATVPAFYMDDLQPTGPNEPVQLMATINGNNYFLLAENLSLNRTHQRRTLNVSGRGRSAVLSDPYSEVMTFKNDANTTAQNLMDDVLQYNGVSIGWEVDWGLLNWQIPAGALNVQGTYIKALKAIVEAAGGYIQPHPTEAIIRALPGYRAMPKDFASITPDFDIPRMAMTKLGVAWEDLPRYNRVFVRGQDTGVEARATIDGTAGNRSAPTVIDPLITDADAARQRATTVLAKTGRQITFTLEMQIFPDIGVLHPGAFIKYRDGSDVYTGHVRSTAINVSRDTTRQTIKLETYAP